MRTPRDPVPCLVQAAERSAQAPGGRQQGLGTQPDAVERDITLDRGAHRKLLSDRRRGDPGGAGGDQEAADAVVGHRPDHQHVRHRGEPDPALGAVQDPAGVVAGAVAAGEGLHARQGPSRRWARSARSCRSVRRRPSGGATPASAPPSPTCGWPSWPANPARRRTCGCRNRRLPAPSPPGRTRRRSGPGSRSPPGACRGPRVRPVPGPAPAGRRRRRTSPRCPAGSAARVKSRTRSRTASSPALSRESIARMSDTSDPSDPLGKPASLLIPASYGLVPAPARPSCPVTSGPGPDPGRLAGVARHFRGARE